MSDTAAFGRDIGPYSARNSTKGALLPETRMVFREIAAGRSIAEVRTDCLAGRILKQRARETRRAIWQALDRRYFTWHPPAWVLDDLRGMVSTDEAFALSAYLHYARRDRLTFDFVTQKLWDSHLQRVPHVSREEALGFLAEGTSLDRGPRWRESTRRKLARNLLSALRDFGVLEGVQRKKLHPPTVPQRAAYHLFRLLHEEGLRGQALLAAPDWRLFLWNEEETSRALSRLSLEHPIRFERSGRTVVLGLPAGSG
jgi:hypothetical protein